MRRRYDGALAAERLAMIRDLLPDAALGTDLIAGFPGEDDAAFERTLAFVERSPLTYGHVFPYSVRSGTTAAKLDGRQSSATITERARRLRAACERKRAEFARRFDGSAAEVLVETTRDRQTGELRGYTRNYLRAHLQGPDTWCGTLVPVRLRVGSQARVEADAAA
jgi:threonylcarbamoyladenosine tRNA methylthiotransferase MtaB